MNKSGLLMIICLLCGCFGLQAQGFSMSRGSGSVYQNMPQEGIYIHQNSTQLFAGERLFYKVYCLNLKNGQLSELSRIAYVKLVDQEKNTVFSHKIRLNNGTGAADFALPTDLVTGSYKIIGYTSWMQSRREARFFESDLVIINPYKVIPENYRAEIIADSIPADSLVVVETRVKPEPVAKEIIGDQLIGLDLDTENTNKRSLINVQLSALNDAVIDGQYSLTVKKLEQELPQGKQTAINYWSARRNLPSRPNFNLSDYS